MDSDSHAHTALQINEDLAYQRQVWRAERIGWAIIALALVAAALGLFSSGPLSSSTARDPRGLLTVEYDRFLRLGAPGVVRLRVAAEAIADDAVTLDIDRTFLEIFELETIHPEPSAATALGDGMRLRFAVVPGAAASMVININPGRAGSARPRLRLAGREPVALSVFVYP